MTAEALFQALRTDLRLREAMRAAKRPRDFVQGAQALGYDISLETLKTGGEPLDDDALDAVSGGADGTDGRFDLDAGPGWDIWDEILRDFGQDNA